MTEPTDTNTLPTERGFRLGFIPRWMLIASLMASNVATLVSDQFHQIAFGLVQRVVSMAGDIASDAMLARSPMRVRRAEVERVARTLRAERDAIRAERDLVVSRHRALQVEHETLKTTAATATRERDEVRAQATKRKAAVKTVVQGATRKIALRSAESLATFPARAVPYVGAAVLVAVTGL